MLSYKKCPLKKRPIFYEDIDNDDQPQDLSLKRKSSFEENSNFLLNLSTNSYYDQIRYASNMEFNKIYLHEQIDGSESPKSIISETSSKNHPASPPLIYDYENIHLRGIKLADYNNYLSSSTTYLTGNYSPQSSSYPQKYTEFSYNLTPPSSPLSSVNFTEPEDLSLKNAIPLSTVSSHQYNQCHQNSPKRSKTIKIKELTRFKCEKCAKSYSTSTGLSKHEHFHCPSAECNQVKKDFSCQSCEKVYTTLGALKMHIRTHTLPCKCPICGKAFSRPWLLQGHIRTHTGEKPFSCQHCHRAFADRSNLRAHQQTHVEIKKYICDVCNKSFSRMSLLTKHVAGGCCAYMPTNNY